MTTPQWLVIRSLARLTAAVAAVVLLFHLFDVDLGRSTTVVVRPTPPTTAPLPWCEGESLVVPGTGIVDFAPRCDQPPEHAPAGTGPTTGPNGEPQ